MRCKAVQQTYKQTNKPTNKYQCNLPAPPPLARTAVCNNYVAGRHERRDSGGARAVRARGAHLVVKVQEPAQDGLLQLLEMHLAGLARGQSVR